MAVESDRVWQADCRVTFKQRPLSVCLCVGLRVCVCVCVYTGTLWQNSLTWTHPLSISKEGCHWWRSSDLSFLRPAAKLHKFPGLSRTRPSRTWWRLDQKNKIHRNAVLHPSIHCRPVSVSVWWCCCISVFWVPCARVPASPAHRNYAGTLYSPGNCWHLWVLLLMIMIIFLYAKTMTVSL